MQMEKMSSNLTRRDFLKVTTGLSLLPVLGKLPLSSQGIIDPVTDPPNIIVIVFDAMSARNLSLYGYPRHTSSTIEKIAERSNVYHDHQAASNSTTPSTASLFSGVYPWKHRVFIFGGLLGSEMKSNNLLDLLPGAYHKAALVQNIYADVLLYEFTGGVDRRLGPDTAGMVGPTFYNHLTPKDAVFGAKSLDQFFLEAKENPASLFFGLPLEFIRQYGKKKYADDMYEQYPEGLPLLKNSDTHFTIGQVMARASELLKSLPEPFFTYLHFMPPHSPYRPSREFLGMFNKDWTPEPKKFHRLATKRKPEVLNRARQKYDEFIANLDSELDKFINNLEMSGVLENSYLILTADHGEMFERGQQGHVNPFLFEALTHIPLLISAPGQRERLDIHATTSNVDLMPTLLNLVGESAPDGVEGYILPGLGGDENPERRVFGIEAKKSYASKPLNKATVAMRRGPYKMIRYTGYKHYQGYELYDLANDPEEIENLYGSSPLSKELQGELDEKILQMDEPYR